MSDVIDPQWDESGKYLYFLASTDYALSTGWLDMSNSNYPVTRALYIAVLGKESASPFEPKSDEEAVKTSTPDNKKPAADTAKKDAANSKAVKIDFEGIQNRIIATNMPPRNYSGLNAGPDGHVFVLESIPNETGSVIHRFSMEDRKAIEFLKGSLNEATSADRRNLLYRNTGGWFIVNTSGPAPKPGNTEISQQKACACMLILQKKLSKSSVKAGAISVIFYMLTIPMVRPEIR